MVGKKDSNETYSKHCVGVSGGESPGREDSCGGPGKALGSHAAVPPGTGRSHDSSSIDLNLDLDRSRDSSKLYKIPKKSAKKRGFS